MTSTSPPTVRPDLIGKTVVEIYDPYSHGAGLIPPSAYLGEFVVAEEDYAAVRDLAGIHGPMSGEGFLPYTRVYIEYDLLEPGERLEEYLPGYSSVFGTPDYVYFQGSKREKWERDRDGARSVITPV
jgi:hypothetical protein